MGNTKLIGPFKQIVTLRGLPNKGPLQDNELETITDGGILVQNGKILHVDKFPELSKISHAKVQHESIEGDEVALPGFVDPHTHICFAGSRANDYAMRIAGKSYLEIAKEGGGIWQTVDKTRNASKEQLQSSLAIRINKLIEQGITTAEVKSGYGLNFNDEIKILEAIDAEAENTALDLVPTCLAAHILPKDFDGNSKQYLQFVTAELLPVILSKQLAKRLDIFIEQGAFSAKEAKDFLLAGKSMGFDITVHGDQFTASGSQVAVEVGAVSVDHLESSGHEQVVKLAQSETTATVLPGASLGLGMAYAPARKLLDSGASVAIGSDWNPGSAPMGNLLLQASLLSASEKLSNAETFAGVTFRAAHALNLNDRGSLKEGKIADLISFPCADYREILYHQGQMKPNAVYKKGIKLK